MIEIDAYEVIYGSKCDIVEASDEDKKFCEDWLEEIYEQLYAQMMGWA